MATVEDLQTDNQVMRSDLKRTQNNTEAAGLELSRTAGTACSTGSSNCCEQEGLCCTANKRTPLADAARAEATRAEGRLLAAREELDRCESERDALRADMSQLRKETEMMQRRLEEGQARLAEADITVDVGQQHLSCAERSLEKMHIDLQKAKRERDTWRTQSHRQKAAFQDEIRAAHEKLIELQRHLSSETDARRVAQV